MSQAAPTTERPLRADAERNRERILDAARSAFAECGLDVGFHEIAQRAGVGVGTVYRRFADKEALIEALFEDRIDEVIQIAETALADGDAWHGLQTFLHETCRMQAADRGLHELVFAGSAGPRCAAGARERIQPLVAQLVARAKEQGALRPDVETYDIGMLRNTLGMFIDRAGESAGEVWPRMLAIVLDGLRAEGSERPPLPGLTPSPELFERVLTQGPARSASSRS